MLTERGHLSEIDLLPLVPIHPLATCTLYGNVDVRPQVHQKTFTSRHVQLQLNLVTPQFWTRWLLRL